MHRYTYARWLQKHIGKLFCMLCTYFFVFIAKDTITALNGSLTSVFISELLGGEISLPKFPDSPSKMLRHVINYTLNANISPSKFAYSLSILVP